MFDYGWRVVGLCIDVQREVVWLSVLADAVNSVVKERDKVQSID